MNAADVMTRNPTTVRGDTPILDALGGMLERGVSGLPVLAGDGTLVGMLTEGDLLRRVETGTERQRPRWLEFLMGSGRLAEDYVRSHARRVTEVMSKDVVSVTPDTPLPDVVALMERHRIKRVPVVDGNTCVGIVSRADLLRALHRALAQQPTQASDNAIREHVLREIERGPFSANASLRVTVQGGVVTLEGVIFDERQRGALRVAAETAPGVREVRDLLTWVDPNIGISFGPEALRSE